jgi:hypothetical protein
MKMAKRILATAIITSTLVLEGADSFAQTIHEYEGQI